VQPGWTVTGVDKNGNVIAFAPACHDLGVAVAWTGAAGVGMTIVGVGTTATGVGAPVGAALTTGGLLMTGASAVGGIFYAYYCQ
jgi:hypothetical protein